MPEQTEAFEPIEQEQWPADPQELPPRPRRRLLTPLPLALAGVLLIACGFVAGVLVEKGQTSSSGGSGTPAALSSRLAGLRSASTSGSSARGSGGGAAGGFASRFGAGGGATVGEVAYVHGSTLYVTNAEGNTVKVSTSEASAVSRTVKSSVKQVHPGETVTVIGEATSGGAILARSISVGSGSGLGALLGAGASGGSRAGGSGTSSSGAGQSLFGG